MIKLIHVRGTIAPTSNFQATMLPKLSKAIETANLADFTGFREMNEQGRIAFDRTYIYTGLAPKLAELVLRLQKFINAKEVKGLNLYGTLMVIMETTDDFPKLYRIIVERGTVTCKEGSVTWQDKAA
jgi:hypothetical protein